jgi:hypothetical protein
VVGIQKFLGTVISLEHRGKERIWEGYLKNSDSATINPYPANVENMVSS